MEECDNTIFLSLSQQFANLTLTQVYAALTYYHANGDEIEAEIAAEEAEAEPKTITASLSDTKAV